jgi:UDP-N-acetylglucosamine 2-epimerase
MSKIVLTVIGARPQFIKAAPVSKALITAGLQEVIVHTGQHYDENMSDLFFEELEIPKPEYNLGVGSMGHGAQTGKMLLEIEKIILDIKPDVLLVYGDTNSTLAGSLAAVKLHIPVAHVEAGLRSRNRKMPEEINRILTDHSSEILFPSTSIGYDNLLNEGIPKEKIHNVGDVMYDTALYYGNISKSKSKILERLGLKPRNYILSTVHRAENTDYRNRLENIFASLNEISKEKKVVLPLHPRTKNCLEKAGFSDELTENILFIEPVGYLDMVNLEQNAYMIITDSGGIQKEAFFHKVPCITMRDETEWLELIDTGWNRLASPANKNTILEVYAQPFNLGDQPDFYGDGSASVQIASLISKNKFNG